MTGPQAPCPCRHDRENGRWVRVGTDASCQSPHGQAYREMLGRSARRYLGWVAECTDEELRDALICLGPEKRARLRELLLSPIGAPSSGDVTATLEGVQGSPPRYRVRYRTEAEELGAIPDAGRSCGEGGKISIRDLHGDGSDWVRIVSVDQERA